MPSADKAPLKSSSLQYLITHPACRFSSCSQHLHKDSTLPV